VRETLRDREGALRRLGEETGLSVGEAEEYLHLLEVGSRPVGSGKEKSVLIEKGMAIISGDGKRVVPVHPRLGVSNGYRTWREQMVREINERRMRVDRLILELIPIYEAANDKRTGREAGH